MEQFPQTERNQVKRKPDRGRYDKATIYPIIDEALICHVGFVLDSQPYVIPTIHARQGDRILLHGAKGSRMLKFIQTGGPVCITITVLDGLVLARSVFHHSLNYRSVVLFGRGELIEGQEEKLAAMEVVTEHLIRGRWQEARRPTLQELDATAVVAVPIESASAKIRTGPPIDDEQDYDLPVWAGVVPIRQAVGEPASDPRLKEGIPAPPSVIAYPGRGESNHVA
ncbi:MAG: pyridoxamine 5'-phosphate oxidase family protein [Nitrospirota bacterium]